MRTNKVTDSQHTMNEKLRQAQHYYSLGFSIIPLPSKSKEPSISWSKYQVNRPLDEQVTKWWVKSPELNIAIICGKISGIIVIDIDDKNKLPRDLFFPPTASVKTARGFHYYYKLKPGQTIAPRKFPWGELRSDGNYVVAPGSTHPSGVTYEWTTGSLPTLEDMDFIPEELLIQLKPHNSPEQAEKLYESAFKGQVDEGSRNSTMASTIGKLLKDFPNRDEWQTTVWEIVKSINEKRCNPPLPINELEHTFKSICKAESTSIKNPSEPKKFIIKTGKEMMSLKLNPKPYLIDRMIAERAINAITADTGKGKSLLMLIMVKHIASGEKLFGEFETKKKKVLIIDQEMDEDLLAERYQDVIGEAHGNVECLYEQPIALNEPKDYEWLKEAIIGNGYGCLVLDTLTNIHTADENSATEMREVNKLLLKLVTDTGITIIYLHHHRKLGKGEKTSQSSSRGSTEIGAKMSSHLLLESKKDRGANGEVVLNFIVKQVKSRRPESVENMSVDVVFDPVTRKTTWKYLGEVKDEGSAVARATEEIPKLLKEHGEMTMKEIKEECSVGNNSITDAIKILVMNNLIEVYAGKKGLHPATKVYKLKDEDDF